MAYIPQQQDVYAFQTTASLASGSVYDSGILALSPEYSQVQTHIRADQNGTIQIFWYSDSAGTDNVRTLTLPYSGSDGFQMFSAPAFAPYIKYTYANGAVAQSDFYYDTKFLTKAINGQVLNMTAPIANGMVGNLTRTVQVGVEPMGTYANNKVDGYAFSTTTPLTSGSTYDSGIMALSPGWSQVQTHVRADQSGTLKIFWYSDAAGTDLVRNLSLPYASTDGFQMFGAPAFAPYIKYTFENGAVDQTDFYYDTKFTTKPINGQVLNMTAPIANGMVANLGRNVIAGVTPDGTYNNQRQDGYAFQTTTLLAPSQQYTSSIFALSPNFSQLQVELVADQPGTLEVDFFADAAGTITLSTSSVDYIPQAGLVSYSSPALAPYSKFKFTNTGAVSQSLFYFDNKLMVKPLSGFVLSTEAPILPEMTANLGRNIIVGRDDAGNFRNAGVNEDGHLKISIDDPTTAFGELQTAQLTPLVQITHPYQINLDLIGTGSTAGGSVSYDGDGRLVNIAASGSSSSAKMYSLKPVKYRNGQGANIRFTTIFGTPTTGCDQIAGWGEDTTGGFFFAYSGSNFGIMYQRSGSAATFISQSDWNIDRMDGTGNLFNPSGQLLDTSKGNVYQIQAQWLGYGAVNYFIESSETGRFAPVHLLKYANSNTVPSVTNPTFPISFNVINTTATSAVTMSNASMAGFVEGQIVYNGVNYSVDGATASGTNKNMLTIFMPPTYQGYANKTQALLKQMTLTTDGTQTVTFTLVKNGTLTGTSFTSAATYSPVQRDITGTYTAASGRQAFKIILQKLDSAQIDLREFEFFMREGDTWSIIANGNNSGAAVSLTWLDDV